MLFLLGEYFWSFKDFGVLGAFILRFFRGVFGV